jgi:hypothetical protein
MPTRSSPVRRGQGDCRKASKLRGVRLLWEESALGLVGAFCVAAFTLGVAWTFLEGFLQISGLISGLLATICAAATLETISRRQYEQGSPQPASRSRRTSELATETSLEEPSVHVGEAGGEYSRRAA